MTRESIFDDIKYSIDSIANKYAIIVAEIGNNALIEDAENFINELQEEFKNLKEAGIADDKLLTVKENISKQCEKINEGLDNIIDKWI